MLEIVEDGPVQAALDRAVDEWEGCYIAWESVTWALGFGQDLAGYFLTPLILVRVKAE